jgi:hypothetical protein
VSDEGRTIETPRSTEARSGELTVDVDTGVYGSRVSMLDFAPADLARFREMGKAPLKVIHAGGKPVNVVVR